MFYSIVSQYSNPLVVSSTLGNLLSLIVVLGSKSFRQTSFGRLLCALAVVDLGVLHTGLLRLSILGMTQERLDIRALTEAGCRFHTFISEFFLQLSSWTLVLMTLERLCSVVAPLRSRQLCTRPRMALAWAIICVSTFATRAQSLWTVSLRQHCEPDDLGVLQKVTICIYSDDYMWYWRRLWPWQHLLLVAALPGTIIVCANGKIISSIKQASARRQEMAKMTPSGRSTGNGNSTGSKVMLVSISVLFVVSNIPMTVFSVTYHFIGLGTSDVIYRQRQWHTAVTVAAYANNTFNFVLYCLSGGKFRRALGEIFLKGRARLSHTFLSTRLSTSLSRRTSGLYAFFSSATRLSTERRSTGHNVDPVEPEFILREGSVELATPDC